MVSPVLLLHLAFFLIGPELLPHLTLLLVSSMLLPNLRRQREVQRYLKLLLVGHVLLQHLALLFASPLLLPHLRRQTEVQRELVLFLFGLVLHPQLRLLEQYRHQYHLKQFFLVLTDPTAVAMRAQVSAPFAWTHFLYRKLGHQTPVTIYFAPNA
jgi:hypothetical protein